MSTKNIPIFAIDEWGRQHGHKTKLALQSSYVSPLSLSELKKLAPNDSQSVLDEDLPLTYGTMQGSLALRQRLAELHSSADAKVDASDVVITTGSILANYLVLTSIAGPGDHVIVQYPTYGQLYILPRFSGAEVTFWECKEENGWVPNASELEALIKPNTKAIILNNPSNPTGTVIPTSLQTHIISLAKPRNILVFSDEVFAPLYHNSDPDFHPPSIVSLGYTNTVSTGSVSKAYGLPGVRVGWVVSRNKSLISQIMTARDYTTLSVSVIDDAVATFALSKNVLPKLLERNLAIVQRSITIIDEFVKRNEGRLQWSKPIGAGTAFVKVLGKNGEAVDDAEFAKQLIESTGVSVIPGGFGFSDREKGDFKGYVRIMLGDDEKLKKGLPLLQEFLAKYEG